MTAKAKATVFISHIDEEKEVALLLKEVLSTAFLGMVDVFVSSDAGSISMGQKWLDQITSALTSCSVEIVICSPVSVSRPWINFEAGAVYIRKADDGSDIPVIPLCHSGVRPSGLPVPLNLLQGAEATDVPGLKLMLPVIASAVGCEVPDVDLGPFVAKVRAFEERYTYWNHVNAAFVMLDKANPEIIEKLRASQVVDKIVAHESAIAKLESKTRFLTERGILLVERVAGVSVVKGQGFVHQLRLVPLENMQATFDDLNFVFHSP